MRIPPLQKLKRDFVTGQGRRWEGGNKIVSGGWKSSGKAAIGGQRKGDPCHGETEKMLKMFPVVTKMYIRNL